MKTVIPEHFIDIDDELQYFDNNPKKVARQKKMIGYGRRYIADDRTTVTDLACEAAKKLMEELAIKPDDVGMLIFVNQKPDYIEPCDANVAHGRLNLPKSSPALQINLGCSGYVYALMTAHAMIEAGVTKTCLLLAGDLCARKTDQTNRKAAPVFGDAASATYVVHSDEECNATFVLGADGKGWDKIVYPYGGMRLPLRKEDFDTVVEDALGNKWKPTDVIMKGEDVFAFTMEVAPQLIQDTLTEAKWGVADVDVFAIHQANKQILDMIVAKAGIPAEKAPTDVFSKYANNSTNSVVTVLCDYPSDVKIGKAVLCAFGIGLSWGGAALDLSGMHNGGISTYHTPSDAPSREEQIEYWAKYFKGEL
jgi:3-oxoacyl-[acyl-carrier-protein] synthase-3